MAPGENSHVTCYCRMARFMLIFSLGLVALHGAYLQSPYWGRGTHEFGISNLKYESVGVMLPMGFCFLSLACMLLSCVFYPDVQSGIIALKLSSSVGSFIAGALVFASVFVWRRALWTLIGDGRTGGGINIYLRLDWTFPATALMVAAILSVFAGILLLIDLCRKPRRTQTHMLLHQVTNANPGQVMVQHQTPHGMVHPQQGTILLQQPDNTGHQVLASGQTVVNMPQAAASGGQIGQQRGAMDHPPEYKDFFEQKPWKLINPNT